MVIKCNECNKTLGSYSEWCLYHNRKRRDFCSLNCVNNYVKGRMEDEEVSQTEKVKNVTLFTETVIDSAHQLCGYKGKCNQVHGHSWLIMVWFKGSHEDVDDVGILVDFGIVKKLHNLLDHTFINDVIHANPTAENLSQWAYGYLKGLTNVDKDIDVKVRIYETAVKKETFCEVGDW